MRKPPRAGPAAGVRPGRASRSRIPGRAPGATRTRKESALSSGGSSTFSRRASTEKYRCRNRKSDIFGTIPSERGRPGRLAVVNDDRRYRRLRAAADELPVQRRRAGSARPSPGRRSTGTPAAEARRPGRLPRAGGRVRPCRRGSAAGRRTATGTGAGKSSSPPRSARRKPRARFATDRGLSKSVCMASSQMS